MFKWPDREQVLSAARRWAGALRTRDPGVRRVCCVGSYARGDWGVGSDVDLIVVVGECPLSPLKRSALCEPADLPVPADVWVYTATEWSGLPAQSPHLWRRLQREMLDLAGGP